MQFQKIITLLLAWCSFTALASTETVELWQFEAAETLGRQTVPAEVPKHATFAARLALSPQVVSALDSDNKISLSVPMYSQPLVLPVKQVTQQEQQHVLTAGDADMRLIMTTDGDNTFATVITERGVWSIQGKGSSGVMYQTHDPFHQHKQMAKDYLIPPEESSTKFKKDQPSAQRESTANSDELVVVDTYIIYNAAVVAMYGPTGAVTRINHLMAVTNDIFENSNVNMRVNALRIDRVEYSQTNNSELALRHATGVSGYTGVLTNARQMRDAIGADAMIFYRPAVNDGTCGIAWMNSGFFSNFWMVSHTSIDCGEEVTAHELGHNMGLAHSRKQGDRGATFPFALGHGVDNNFSTVMAYPWSFGSASRVFKFSSPDLSCNGLPCGVDRTDPVNGADSVYALNQKRFEIAGIAQRASMTGTLQVLSAGVNGVSLQSNTGQAGTTPYQVNELELGTLVRLTAPATASNEPFAMWIGCDAVIDRICEVSIRGDVSLTVVYADGADNYGTNLDAPELTFTSSGDALWQPDFTFVAQGFSSLRSGKILDNQSSIIRTTLEGPGLLRFSWRVSSESDYDFLNFFINGERVNSISGSTYWQVLEYNLAEGVHNVEWRYTKDFSVSIGEDAGWLDAVAWQPIVPEVTVSVQKSGNGKGTLTATADSFNCDENCNEGSFVVPARTTITLSAQAAVGSNFLGWSGACSGTENCVLIPTSDVAVTAQFSLQQVLVEVASSVGGSIQKDTEINYFGEFTTFTLSPAPGFSVSRTVQGTCPAGEWISATQYRTGALTAACSISFKFVERKRRRLPVWLFLEQ